MRGGDSEEHCYGQRCIDHMMPHRATSMIRIEITLCIPYGQIVHCRWQQQGGKIPEKRAIRRRAMRVKRGARRAVRRSGAVPHLIAIPPQHRGMAGALKTG
jgi:hypothetical protein